MESNQVEDWKDSSDDTDQSDQSNDATGTGRFYECVFCKRGFTTAQALGGHMNIHRKDRAKSNMPSTSVPTVSNKVDVVVDDDDDNENYNVSLSSVSPEVIPLSHQTFIPDSGWGFRRHPHEHHGDHHRLLFVDDNSQHMINPFEDWPRRHLSLGIGPSHVYENNKTYGNSQEDDELDLELRLGHS